MEDLENKEQPKEEPSNDGWVSKDYFDAEIKKLKEEQDTKVKDLLNSFYNKQEQPKEEQPKEEQEDYNF